MSNLDWPNKNIPKIKEKNLSCTYYKSNCRSEYPKYRFEQYIKIAQIHKTKCSTNISRGSNTWKKNKNSHETNVCDNDNKIVDDRSVKSKSSTRTNNQIKTNSNLWEYIENYQNSETVRPNQIMKTCNLWKTTTKNWLDQHDKRLK